MDIQNTNNTIASLYQYNSTSVSNTQRTTQEESQLYSQQVTQRSSVQVSLSEGGLGLYGPAEPVSLTAEETEQLNQLFDQLDKLFETVGDAPLSADQEKQLDAITSKIDGILGIPPEDDLQSLGLSEQDTKALETLFEQMDKIFANAGERPLTAQQEKQLDMLNKKIDGILGVNAAKAEDIYAGLSDAEARELDTLFEQMDKIFAIAGDNPLSAEQEKQLDAIAAKVDNILGIDEEQDLAAEFNLSEEDTQALNLLFEQIDQLFGNTSNNGTLSNSQERQLAALEQRINDLLGLTTGNSESVTEPRNAQLA